MPALWHSSNDFRLAAHQPTTSAPEYFPSPQHPSRMCFPLECPIQRLFRHKAAVQDSQGQLDSCPARVDAVRSKLGTRVHKPPDRRSSSPPSQFRAKPPLRQPHHKPFGSSLSPNPGRGLPPAHRSRNTSPAESKQNYRPLLAILEQLRRRRRRFLVVTTRSQVSIFAARRPSSEPRAFLAAILTT